MRAKCGPLDVYIRAGSRGGGGGGGGLGVTGPPHIHTTQLYALPISFGLGGSRSMKVAIPFGGGDVRGSRNLGGSSTSFK